MWLVGSRPASVGDNSGASKVFVYKKRTEKGWVDHVDNMEALREIEKVPTLQVNADLKEKWIHAVVVVVSNTDKGWDWVVYTVGEHIGVKGTLYINNFAADRGILFMLDMKANARMLDMGQLWKGALRFLWQHGEQK